MTGQRLGGAGRVAAGRGAGSHGEALGHATTYTASPHASVCARSGVPAAVRRGRTDPANSTPDAYRLRDAHWGRPFSAARRHCVRRFSAARACACVPAGRASAQARTSCRGTPGADRRPASAAASGGQRIRRPLAAGADRLAAAYGPAACRISRSSATWEPAAGRGRCGRAFGWGAFGPTGRGRGPAAAAAGTTSSAAARCCEQRRRAQPRPSGPGQVQLLLSGEEGAVLE